MGQGRVAVQGVVGSADVVIVVALRCEGWIAYDRPEDSPGEDPTGCSCGVLRSASSCRPVSVRRHEASRKKLLLQARGEVVC